jgi:hypothetical protein
LFTADTPLNHQRRHVPKALNLLELQSQPPSLWYSTSGDKVNKFASMTVASVYVHYVNKVTRKDRTTKELDQVICWLTGFSATDLKKHLKNETTFEDFFKQAKLNKNAKLITGTICGVRIEEIEDPLMKKIRYLDKLVDELAKGRPMEKILRA